MSGGRRSAPGPRTETGHAATHEEIEETPLYRIVETHYPQFLARLEAEGGSLPAFVKREFDDYLKCGLLENGFLRVKCDACSHEHLVAFSCKRRGFCPSCGVPRPRLNLTRFHGRIRPELQAPQVRRTKTQTQRGATEQTPRSHDLDAATETRIRHRHRDVPGVRRQAQGDCLHRRPRGDRQDPRPHSATGWHRTATTTARATNTLRTPRRPQPGQAVLEHRLTLACNPSLFQDALARSFRQVSVPRNLSPPRSTTLCRSATTHHPSGLRPSSHISGGYFSYPHSHNNRKRYR